MRVIACLALALSFAGSAALAQEPLEKVTVNVRQIPLRAALKQMLAGTSVTFRVDDNVPDVPVTLNSRDVGPAALLRLVVRLAREAKGAEALFLVKENGVFRLKLDPALRAKQLAQEEGAVTHQQPPIPVDAAFRDPKLARTIIRSFRKQTLREIADALFTGTGCPYSFSGKSNEIVISLELKGVTLLNGLREAVAAARKERPTVGLWRDGDVYVIGPKYWKTRPDQP